MQRTHALWYLGWGGGSWRGLLWFFLVVSLDPFQHCPALAWGINASSQAAGGKEGWHCQSNLALRKRGTFAAFEEADKRAVGGGG